MSAVDGEVDRFEKGGLERRAGKQAKRIARHGAVMTGPLQGVGQRAMTLDQALRLFEIALALIELLQCALPEFAIHGATAQEREDHRQGDLALAEVVADGTGPD